jgi:hypothetical protein
MTEGERGAALSGIRKGMTDGVPRTGSAGPAPRTGKEREHDERSR